MRRSLLLLLLIMLMMGAVAGTWFLLFPAQ